MNLISSFQNTIRSTKFFYKENYSKKKSLSLTFTKQIPNPLKTQTTTP